MFWTHVARAPRHGDTGEGGGGGHHLQLNSMESGYVGLCKLSREEAREDTKVTQKNDP